MRRLGVVLALLLFSVSGHAKSLPELAEFLRERVVRIHMAGPNALWAGTCTAFGIDATRGWGITAEHCVQTRDGFRYQLYDDARRPLTLLVTSTELGPHNCRFLPQMLRCPDDDIALIQGKTFTERPALVAQTVVPAPGVQVAAGGFAVGRFPAFFWAGTIARTYPEWFHFEVQGPILQGMSGSPLVTAEGLAVGVVTKGTYGHTLALGSWHFFELREAALKKEN
jgi:hypothetical protein